ncbi:hypothetical protein [Kribbella sp. NPDC049584]|uniref:hypothetical protein n=1 Tax=Kribbella sp. NPDC049584 TaxID=3154833 RepID=UPI003415550A
MTVDALLGTSEFVELAGKLGDACTQVMQFRLKPRSDVNYEDARQHVRVARYRAAELTIRIDLPHARETALITAVDPHELGAATARLMS